MSFLKLSTIVRGGGRDTESGSDLAWCDKDSDKNFSNPFLSGNCLVMETKELMFEPQDYPDKAG